MDTNTEELIKVSLSENIEKFSLHGEYKKALITDVYDGDTVTVIFKHFDKINSWKLRLLGINSPELRPGKNIENRERVISSAKAARDYLSGLLLNKIVFIKCGEFDSFGRILSEIYMSAEDLLEGEFEKSINNLMLKTNNAVEY